MRGDHFATLPFRQHQAVLIGPGQTERFRSRFAIHFGEAMQGL
jgi:hypothetical protein